MTAYLQTFLEQSDPATATDLLASFLQPATEVLRLDQTDVIANIVLFLVAGHATTTNLIGNAAFALLRHPDQLSRLRTQPGLVKPAIEELLRFDSPVQVLLRRPVESMEVGDTKLEKGDAVLLIAGAANHDPAVFDSPHELDLSRSGPRHVSFGKGPHSCIGAALARLEAQIAVPALIESVDDLRITDARPAWELNLAFRGLEYLHLAW